MVNHCIGDVDDKIVNFGIHLRASLLSGGSGFRVRAGHSLVVITIVPLCKGKHPVPFLLFFL